MRLGGVCGSKKNWSFFFKIRGLMECCLIFQRNKLQTFCLCGETFLNFNWDYVWFERNLPRSCRTYGKVQQKVVILSRIKHSQQKIVVKCLEKEEISNCNNVFYRLDLIFLNKLDLKGYYYYQRVIAMSGGDAYISKKKDGLPSKDDEEWIQNTLDSFTNRQTALFKRWVSCKLPGVKETKNRLIVLTPLRFLCIRKRAFGRSIHKIIRVIDFIGIEVDGSNDKDTAVTIETCPFAVDNSIIQSRQSKSVQVLQYQFRFLKDIDKEFLDILQWLKGVNINTNTNNVPT
ncbi:hypothetical protein RFI_14768 [Reticulomyxa filosa]|uniref:Uncharacterized protein n=1 Tax=Reticulomyxa filosa TaxID=46433 RepID=X6N967_RETFI|nr:hypothetical protein RFI_14768 [Reticulomyxa filosa]|eukprot:ETO22433.1 hypothetical protein RFI_14768 [Reticulomyxa filosa]